MIQQEKYAELRHRINTHVPELTEPVAGCEGIWHKPASEQDKAKDIPARVIERSSLGDTIYIFTLEPIKKGYDNITWRTATIFPSDFEVLGTSPSLADVLRAIRLSQGTGGISFAVQDFGCIMWFGQPDENYEALEWNEVHGDGRRRRYDLTKPLSEQSEETLDFLLSIITI